MRALLLAVLLVAVPALAGPAEPAGPERREKRTRLMLVVGLAESLELSEAEALRLAEKLRAFDDRRRPLRQEMHESMRVLKKAAEGDTASFPLVDQAMVRVLENRRRLAELDKEMISAVAKDLVPQKKAQLALFLARFGKEARQQGERAERRAPRERMR